jgi:hypothetical protein
MKTDRQRKIDAFKRATPEQRRAFELAQLTAKKMNAAFAEEELAGRNEPARILQVLAKTVEQARQSGGPQQRFMAIAGAIAQLEGAVRRADDSGQKKLGGCLRMFAIELRAIVFQPVKIINERPRKRRQLPLPRHRKRKRRARAQGHASAA